MFVQVGFHSLFTLSFFFLNSLSLAPNCNFISMPHEYIKNTNHLHSLAYKITPKITNDKGKDK